jgi:hypothetical protein
MHERLADRFGVSGIRLVSTAQKRFDTLRLDKFLMWPLVKPSALKSFCLSVRAHAAPENGPYRARRRALHALATLLLSKFINNLAGFSIISFLFAPFAQSTIRYVRLIQDCAI